MKKEGDLLVHRKLPVSPSRTLLAELHVTIRGTCSNSKAVFATCHQCVVPPRTPGGPLTCRVWGLNCLPGRGSETAPYQGSSQPAHGCACARGSWGARRRSRGPTRTGSLTRAMSLGPKCLQERLPSPAVPGQTECFQGGSEMSPGARIPQQGLERLA